jgi:hypothetical protein
MSTPKRSRKWVAFITVVVFVSTALVMSFLLALLGKLTADWATICTILSGSLTVAAGAYTAGNSYVTGKGQAFPPSASQEAGSA